MCPECRTYCSQLEKLAHSDVIIKLSILWALQVSRELTCNAHRIESLIMTVVLMAAILAAILNFAKNQEIGITFDPNMINRQTIPFSALFFVLLKEFIGILIIISRRHF